MSKTVDLERAKDAKEAGLERGIAVCEELLRILRARREGIPVRAIADRIDRSRSTVYEREETLQLLLRLVELKGRRRRT